LDFFIKQLRYTPILLAALRHNAVAASVLLKAGAITNINTVTLPNPIKVLR
jgi:hypothetical protein